MRTLLKQSLLLTLLALPLLMANAQSRNEWYGKQAMQGEHLTLNPEIIEIFNTLDKTFPKRYLINEEPNHVGMWVVYKFKGRKEYEEYRPLIKKLIDRINRMHGSETIVIGAQQYTQKNGLMKSLAVLLPAECKKAADDLNHYPSPPYARSTSSHTDHDVREVPRGSLPHGSARPSPHRSCPHPQ